MDLKIAGEQFFDEYILVAPGSDYGRAMWSDIGKLENGTILESALKPTNKFLSLLHHIHFSFAINRKFQMPFQSIWKRLYSLEGVQFEPDKSYCVIYTDVSAARTDCKYFAEKQKEKNITMVLIMVNTMARRGSLIEKRRQYFSQVYSFDRKDCETYGFIYHPTNYSMASMDSSLCVTQDAFFVGVSKGRAGKIAGIYERLTESGAKSEFYIAGIGRGEERKEGIHYNQWLSYQQILENIRNSNCIVEVMDGAQEGVTLRTMEAICYNKKLLTDNQSIKDTPYYESGNIQVFTRPDEIDVGFVRSKSNVDYHYKGEFSPIHLLEHINKTRAEQRK
ncbi:MAG: hypothetical protein ACLRTI_11395 [Blautia sp.]